MRQLITESGLPDPDEVIRDARNEELVLLWHETRLAVTIELDQAQPRHPSGSAGPQNCG